MSTGAQGKARQIVYSSFYCGAISDPSVDLEYTERTAGHRRTRGSERSKQSKTRYDPFAQKYLFLGRLAHDSGGSIACNRLVPSTGFLGGPTLSHNEQDDPSLDQPISVHQFRVSPIRSSCSWRSVLSFANQASAGHRMPGQWNQVEMWSGLPWFCRSARFQEAKVPSLRSRAGYFGDGSRGR